MSEDSWLKNERDSFLKVYESTPPMTENMRKFAKTMLEKYNARLVKSLFGESPYVAQNLKESLLKSRESEDNGK